MPVLAYRVLKSPKALAGLSADPITHLINTHWHFDHADGNVCLNSGGAKFIAHEITRKHLSEVQRVEDWDYNFLPLQTGGSASLLDRARSEPAGGGSGDGRTSFQSSHVIGQKTANWVQLFLATAAWSRPWRRVFFRKHSVARTARLQSISRRPPSSSPRPDYENVRDSGEP